MVSITQGDKVFGEQKLRITAPTGEYADVDLIECADSVSAEPTGAFQAQYVKYGPMVYQFSAPEDLGAAIIAVDPESTHDAAQLWREDEARRIKRMGGTLTPEDPTPAPDAMEPEPVVPQEEVLQEEADTTEVVENTPEESPATTTPETPNEPPVEPEMPVIDVDEPPAEPLPEGEVAGSATSTPGAPEPEIPVIQMDEPLDTPTLPEEVLLSNSSTTTPQ